MKVGITCYPTYGGSGIVATELGLELANRLTHPRYGVPKTYRALVRGILDETLLDRGRRALLKELRKADRQEGLDLLLRMLVVPLTKEQMADWQPDTPAGAEAYRLRNRQLYRIGRALVENWLDDEPENQAAAKWLDELRIWAEQQKLEEAATPASHP